VGVSNSYAKTLIFGPSSFIAFLCWFFLSFLSFFCHLSPFFVFRYFYCLPLFCVCFFIALRFASFFTFVFVSVFRLLWVSSLIYPNLLRNKRLGCCCCCDAQVVLGQVFCLSKQRHKISSSFVLLPFLNI
jgi:hypothetical protein